MGLQVTVFWVPGHYEIAGNGAADREAAAAILRNEVDVTRIPYQDLNALIGQKLRKQLPEWDTQTESKRCVIKPKIERYKTEKRYGLIEIKLCRLRIEHTHGTHSYLLNARKDHNVQHLEDGALSCTSLLNA